MEVAKSKADNAHDLDLHPEEKGKNDIVIESAAHPGQDVISEANDHSHSDNDDDVALQKIYPTEDEMQTLHRVADKVPWTSFTIAVVELCERFSYYGTTAVCKLEFALECLRPRDLRLMIM